MKKTFAFKPLAILTLVFNILIFIGTWGISSGFSSYFSGNVDYNGIVSSVINNVVFLATGLLGSVVCVVLLFIYYIKREKVYSVLADAILNTVIVALFLNIMLGGTEKILMSVYSNNGLGGTYNLSMILSFISALFNLFIILRLEGIVHINVLDLYLPAGKGKQTGNTSDFNSIMNVEQPAAPVMTKEGIIKFLKSKNGKMTMIVVAVVVCLFGGYKAWDRFFNKTTIDAFGGMEVVFEGYNGEGSALINYANIDYDITNASLEMFIDDIDYNIENNGSLSNGDKVKITVSYSKETAKKLKLVLKEESHEFEVRGLTVKYQNVSEIDQNLYKEAYKSALNYAQNDLGDVTFYKAYYLSYPKEEMSYQDNRLIFVFKYLDEVYDSEQEKDIQKTIYTSYYVYFDSSFDSQDPSIHSATLYGSDGWDLVFEESEVFDSLKGSYAIDEGRIEEISINVE